MGKKRTGHPGHLYLIQTQSLKCMMKLHGVDKAQESKNQRMASYLLCCLRLYGPLVLHLGNCEFRLEMKTCDA